MNRKYKLIGLLGRPYALEILQSLHQAPKRYTDLKNICPVDKTRTKRLRELEKEELIETISLKIENKHRTFIHYKLSKKGAKIVQAALEMLKEQVAQ
jgi:DNA-binding HxlR family transcriptional regulator